MKSGALLIVLAVAATASFCIFVFMNQAPSLNITTLTEEAYEGRMKEFGESCVRLDAALNDEQRIEEFDRFYDLVKATLLESGSFSEDGIDLDADFLSSRWVDPQRVLTIVSSVPVTEELLRKLLTGCAVMGPDYAIEFDGIDGTSVLFMSGEFVRERR